MIIKSLWKAVKWLTIETPVPELAFLTGIAGMSLAVHAAYAAQPTEQKTKQVPVEQEDADPNEPPVYHVDVDIVLKTSPTDVWDCLSTEHFSIRDAVKTYNAMDKDGQRVFKIASISMACIIYSGIAFTARQFRYCRKIRKLDILLTLERGWAERTVSVAEGEIADAQRIVNLYKKEFAEGKWADNSQAYCNYRNQLHDIMILRTMVDTYKTIKEAKIA